MENKPFEPVCQVCGHEGRTYFTRRKNDEPAQRYIHCPNCNKDYEVPVTHKEEELFNG